MEIAYRGAEWHGWQEQKNAKTVQEEVNIALSTLLQGDIKCVGSGRTDAGVHALHQPAHFDSASEIETEKLLYRLNAILPESISLTGLKRVKDTFHARFDAVSRSYNYYLHTGKDPFKKGTSYFFPHDIDSEMIRDACKILSSWKDFEALSKVKTDVNNFNCEIYGIQWIVDENGYLLNITANRFLRGMVRTIVGTLLDIGTGKLSLDKLTLVLESKDRRQAGRSVPAHGLFLSRVEYPQDIYI